MEQIKILFFVLSSFFGIEDGRIIADKTTITINPKSQKINIIQEDLFSIIKTEKDSTTIIEQWNDIIKLNEKKSYWSKDLDNFTGKNFSLKSTNKTIQAHLALNYLNEKNLRVMGIWYNTDKNEFSVNHIPQENLKTKEGELVGNYWVFKGDDTFSYTIEPFLQIPENYKKFKKPLKQIINKH